ncbi:fructosamine kinase [Natronospirillum operosum]|uniref:Fructosamine kinase n=1 Tax=Natronospirillum operosum TaxID=2759953 RepID=A0A4Z0WCM1_9GAMM|nr:fructosamine kinase family protein [Natronospirillum operosum]TGG91553.1 fructosamine kinase [Natronospirillum operosum]
MDDLVSRWSLTDQVPVGGGSINQAFAARTAEGERVFLKTHPHPPPGFFAAEAAGLQALARAGAPVPEVLDVVDSGLLLSHIETGSAGPRSMEALGEVLAALHEQHGPHFGFEADNYCGLSVQHNAAHDNGHDFFINCRLLPQGQRAFDEGLLTRPWMQALERLCSQLGDLIPQQPPSLIHGDLWSGNVLFDAQRQPVLIDPAVSWSWAEADLAMTRLFGGFGPELDAAYQSIRRLDPGLEERIPLYNLYHLLNHLNLFGGGYQAAVTRVLQPWR